MIFENDSNREHQQTLAWLLESIGFHVEHTSTLCEYDFKLYRGDTLHAIVEYKARDKLWDPLIVDTQKIRQLCHAAQQHECKPIFMVGCPGPPYHFIEAHTDYPVGAFTRKKDGKARGETQDEVFHIPAAEFNLL